MQNQMVAMKDQLVLMKEELEIKRAWIEFEKEQAQLMIDSGLLPPTIKTVPQFLALTSYGKMLGVDTWTALKHIHVINGSPEPDGQLKLALVYRSGLLESMKVDNNGKEATVTVKRVDREPMAARYTWEQAEAAGLTGKDNWKKYGPDMLAWKATIRALKRAFPDIINGLTPPEPKDPLVIREFVDSTPEPSVEMRLGNGNGHNTPVMTFTPPTESKREDGRMVNNDDIEPPVASPDVQERMSSTREPEVPVVPDEPQPPPRLTATEMKAKLAAIPLTGDEPEATPPDNHDVDISASKANADLFYAHCRKVYHIDQPKVRLCLRVSNLEQFKSGWKAADRQVSAYLKEEAANTSRAAKEAEPTLRKVYELAKEKAAEHEM